MLLFYKHHVVGQINSCSQILQCLFVLSQLFQFHTSAASSSRLSTPLQYAARMLPRQEWAVAESAPGKLVMEGAPIDRARTTARAEFCIPVSIEMVRDVRSPNLKTLRGTRYPVRNPTVWRPSTADTIIGISPTPPDAGVETRREAFSATTPPLFAKRQTSFNRAKNSMVLAGYPFFGSKQP